MLCYSPGLPKGLTTTITTMTIVCKSKPPKCVCRINLEPPRPRRHIKLRSGRQNRKKMEFLAKTRLRLLDHECQWVGDYITPMKMYKSKYKQKGEWHSRSLIGHHWAHQNTDRGLYANLSIAQKLQTIVGLFKKSKPRRIKFFPEQNWNENKNDLLVHAVHCSEHPLCEKVSCVQITDRKELCATACLYLETFFAPRAKMSAKSEKNASRGQITALPCLVT